VLLIRTTGHEIGRRHADVLPLYVCRLRNAEPLSDDPLSDEATALSGPMVCAAGVAVAVRFSRLIRSA